MKQNKRFWLVAVALLLATLMVSGLALAAESKITAILGEDGKTDYTYTFYAWGYDEETMTYKGLFSENKRIHATGDAGDLGTTLTLSTLTPDAEMVFDYRDNDTNPQKTPKFLIKTNGGTKFAVANPTEVYSDANVYTYDTTAGTATYTLTWDGKSTGEYTLTIVPFNDSTTAELADKEQKEYGNTFKVVIKPVSVLGLQITNDVKDDTFNYNLVNVAEETPEYYRVMDSELKIVEKFVNKGLVLRNKGIKYDKPAVVGQPEEPEYGGKTQITVERANSKEAGTYKNVAKSDADVQYEVVYDPADAIDHDPEFVKNIEKKIYGFVFEYDNKDLGTFRKIVDCAAVAGKPGGEEFPHTYLNWNNKAGALKITVKAVDSKRNVIAELKSATANVNFVINKEKTIEITVKKGDKKVEVPQVVVDDEDLDYGNDIYYLTDFEGNRLTTSIYISDGETNGVDPTYQNYSSKYQDIYWYSENEDIIKISKDGYFKALKIGKATIVAQGKYEKGKIVIEVVEAPKSAIKTVKFNQPDPAVYVLAKGQTRWMEAFVITDPIDNFDYVVETSDPTIVRVNNYGREDSKSITAMKKGDVTLTVYPTGKPELAVKATVKVVKSDAKAEFMKKALTVKVGRTEGVGWKLEKVNDLAFEYSTTGIATVYDWDEDVITFRGVKPGKVIVTVMDDEEDVALAEIEVTVVASKAKEIKLKKDSIKLYYIDSETSGDNAEVDKSDTAAKFSNYVQYNPTNYTIDKDFWTYDTDNPAVAIVGLEGTITATGVGEATITGSYDDGVNKDELKLKVKVAGKEIKPAPEPEPAKANPIEVEVDQYYIMVVKGGDNTLQATAYDTVTGEEVDVTWSSSDRKLATVSKSGVITGKGAGRAVITATTKDGTQKFSIGVKILHKPVEEIKTDAEVTLVKGEKYTPVIEIEPKHAYDKRLSFKSSDKKVATVNENGTITAKKPGTAIITVKAKDGSGVTATIKVTVTK